MALAVSLQPMWTKRVATEMSGRDPLGLSRLGDTIKEFLLSGINVSNHRARYYSFYSWALWHIEHEEKPGNYRAFVAAFRRREAAMAIATVLNKSNASPIGIKAVRPKLEKGLETGDFDCDFKVLPSHALGGYGQYYSGSLYHLKLYHRLENSFDTVTQGIAEDLAQTFHATIEHTPYIKKKLYRGTTVNKNDLIKSKEFFTLDALEQPFCREERTKLINIFFGFNEGSGTADVLRRHSLTLLLHAIVEYERQILHVNVAKGRILDRYLLYTFYYDVLWLNESKTSSYQAPEALRFCHDLWKQFCLHQFFTEALESLLYSVLEVLSVEGTGLTLSEVINRLLLPDFFEALRATTSRNCDQPYDLLKALGITQSPDEATSQKLQKKVTPIHQLSEAKVLDLEPGSAQNEAARGILLLATLYGKWRGISQGYAINYVAARARQDLWIGSILLDLDRWLNPQVSWSETLQELIEKFILNQHDQVMYEKGKLESCWLQRIGGRIIKEQDYDPSWRSSRHSNAVRIMGDLGLLRINDYYEVSVTPQGRKVLEKALRLSNGSQKEYR